MKKTFTVMTLVMAMVLSTMSMALADTDLWDNDDVLDSDDTDTTVPRPFEPDPDPEPDPIPQDASITLTGPEFLDVDEEGTYTVEVTNKSNDRDLDKWVLGLSVTNIKSADDLTIKFTGSNFDITEGSAGVEVEVNNDVIYLRGSDDPTIPVNQSKTFTFKASFAKEGNFTGTAYVIDEDPFRNVTFESEEFLPYFNKDGGTDTNEPPPTKPLSGDGQNFEQGAEYEFDFCTLDRTRYEIGGDRVLSINNQRCFNDGEVEYQHRAVLMNKAHPDFDDTPGAVGFGGAWKVIEFDVLVPAEITVDPTDFADINTWSTFPA